MPLGGHKHSFLLYMYPGVRLLDHRTGKSLTLEKKRQFSKEVVPIYPPSINAREFQLLHIFSKLGIVKSFKTLAQGTQISPCGQGEE